MNKILSLFKTIYHAITNTIPKELREYSDRSLQVTYGLKKVLESPVADIITSIIPGTWDDKLQKSMLDYIDEVLPYLLVVNTCKDKEDTNEMLQCWVDELRKLPNDVRNAMLIKLAALLTAKLDNNELKQSQYDYAVQALYTGSIKKGNYEAKYGTE